MNPVWTIVVAIISGAIPLIGVWFTLRHQQKQFLQSLSDEHQKRHEERRFTERRAALLNAMECLARYLTDLEHRADRDPNELDANSALELNISIDKLYCFCSVETVKAAITLNQLIEDVERDVIAATAPAHVLRARQKAAEKSAEGFAEPFQYYVRRHDEAVKGGNEKEIETHRRTLEYISKEISLSSEKVEQLRPALYAAVERARDVTYDGFSRIYPKAAEFLVAARRELEFGGDLKEIETALEGAWQHRLARGQEIIRTLREEAERLFEESQRASK